MGIVVELTAVEEIAVVEAAVVGTSAVGATVFASIRKFLKWVPF